jgi:hypothetical protein
MKKGNTTAVKCEKCGEVRQVRNDNLKNMKTNLCRKCYRTDLKSHGDSHSHLHNIWSGMKNRCHNPHNAWFHLYGGRMKHNGKPNITIHHSWQNYANFKAWSINNGYAPNKKLIRVDTDGDYIPNNCRWV